MTVDDGAVDQVRITIRHGDPTDVEVAALTAVVVGIAGQQRPAAPPVPPAWGRAARLEAIGAAPLSSAADPRLSGATRR